jgi:ADP-heptose:LPS heptosyltransferase
MVRYLVIRFSSIGDIILTTPVVRHLKKQVEGAEVHYLTKSAFAPLLEANPYIDRVHLFEGDMKKCLEDLRETGFDYIIDLHHNVRSARIKFVLKRMYFAVRKLNLKKWIYVNFKLNLLPDRHIVERNLDTISLFIGERDHLGLDYFIPAEQRVDPSTLPPAFREGYIAMAIGAKHQTKKLPVESLTAICSGLAYPVILLGDQGDRETGDAITGALPGRDIWNCCGKYSMNESASLVEQCNLLITHDTGLMHTGAAFRKKILTIWGNTTPELGMYAYRPHPASVNFEVKGLRCRPCSKLGYKSCPRGHFKCMLEQDLEGIVNTATRLFPADRKPG